MKNVARVEPATLEQAPPISGEVPAGEFAAEKQVQVEQIETPQQALEAEAREHAGGAEGKATPEAARPAPKAQRNFRDPESRIMKTADGFQQCDHAQGAVTVRSQLNGVIAHSGYFSEANVQSVELLPPLLVARRGGREGRVPAGLRGPQSRQAPADRGGRDAPDALTVVRPVRDDLTDTLLDVSVREVTRSVTEAVSD